MIQTEFYAEREDGTRLVRSYSDSNRYIIQTGTNAVYEEAVDIEGLHTYVEGDEIPVDTPTDDDYAQVGRILMGVQDEDNG